MANINFVGNVGKDSEIRFTKSGRPVLNFSVADSKSKRLDNGEFEEIASQWFNVSLWGDEAEFYSERILKGTRVEVFGEFYSRKFDSQSGPGTSLDVTAKGVNVFPPRNGQGQRQASRSQESPWAAPEASSGTSDGWGDSSPAQANTEPPF